MKVSYLLSNCAFCIPTIDCFSPYKLPKDITLGIFYVTLLKWGFPMFKNKPEQNKQTPTSK